MRNCANAWSEGRGCPTISRTTRSITPGPQRRRRVTPRVRSVPPRRDGWMPSCKTSRPPAARWSCWPRATARRRCARPARSTAASISPPSAARRRTSRSIASRRSRPWNIPSSAWRRSGGSRWRTSRPSSSSTTRAMTSSKRSTWDDVMLARLLSFLLAPAFGLALMAPAAAQSRAELPPLPDLKFAEISAASRDKFLGDRWSYMEAGRADAPPLVLLHGVGANSMHWRFQLAGLSDRFRVVAWNAPGYVLSDAFKTETPGCKDFADALADFLAALKLDRVHMV